MDLLRAAAGALTPPRCAACGRQCPAQECLCDRCAGRLEATAPVLGRCPAGIDFAWSAAPHEGVARQLVIALKFRRLVTVARPLAERIADRAPLGLLDGALVPVPAAPGRLRARGFDPASEIAAALGRDLGSGVVSCLARRGRGRQVGRNRAGRIAEPPRIGAAGDVPEAVVLVDDVMTTGATLGACAAALRDAGCLEVMAATFTCRL